jgi:hypothetical protein
MQMAVALIGERWPSDSFNYAEITSKKEKIKKQFLKIQGKLGSNASKMACRLLSHFVIS